MAEPSDDEHPLATAREDAAAAVHVPDTPQTRSPSYRLAFTDRDFLLREELRPVRLQLELLKPELELRAQRIESTVVVFGSARVSDPENAARDLEAAELAAARDPDDLELVRQLATARRRMARARYYAEAQRFAALVTRACQAHGSRRMVVVTGGGPGVMEAANRGALEAGGVSIGLNIVLPHEQAPNRFVTPELCFQFHYFALRKMHFLMRAAALVVFPGGFGTLDELFETLCLIQTRKIRPIPVLLVGRDYWRRLLDLRLLVEEEMIAPRDLELLTFVDTADEAWSVIAQRHGLSPTVLDEGQGDPAP
jgi:uncharacterized protein (TIGR00730 family)